MLLVFNHVEFKHFVSEIQSKNFNRSDLEIKLRQYKVLKILLLPLTIKTLYLPNDIVLLNNVGFMKTESICIATQ